MGKEKSENRYVADLRRLDDTHTHVRRLQAQATPFLVAFLFLGLTTVAVLGGQGAAPVSVPALVAAVIGGYMALNIGANDVANNMGPAVGGRVLTIGAAIIIAAICEASGALIAGGDVVQTVAKGITNPEGAINAREFVTMMISALLAAALWINLATMLNAPVSTTHSIVGGVLGGGITAAGFGLVDWHTMGAIVASWIISPIIGGLIAAAMLWTIRHLIFSRKDRIAAANRWVPALISVMVSAFATYLCLKGLSKILSITTVDLVVVAILSFLLSLGLATPYVRMRTTAISNRKKDIRTLFRLPLIMGAGLLSFAHGANDVANAVGPLAAIASIEGGTSLADGAVNIPLWVMLIGAAGISLGLALFGPKLIRTVGEKITRLNPVRAYCVLSSSALTVLIASALGLPVSSTHIAVGAIFGVGFLREFLEDPRRKRKSGDTLVNNTPEEALTQGTLRRKRMLVRRKFLVSIASAWVITVPAAAGLASLIYVGLSLF